MSLYLQQVRGLSGLGAGVAFLPMMLIGAVLTPFAARLAERFGARTLVAAGLLAMTAGLAGALLASRATFAHGMRISLLIAVAVALAAAAASLLARRTDDSSPAN
jgi:MFS transporter, DHA2 family, methylenomycin A resistance protein